ncbi:MAG: transporter [Spirochaetales bacterium]|nr:transporter [Spirochaetales bacterium]
MKKSVLVVIFCLIVFPVFCQEEHKLIIGTGLESEFRTGYYSSNGEISGSPSTPSTFNIPVTIYYRIIGGLELGVKEGFKLETADSDVYIGIDQPAISVRYTLDFGLGAYVDMYLPVGSEDIIGPDPEIFYNFALFYYVDIANFFISAETVYMLTFADANDTTNDNFKISVQPGYVPFENFQITLGIEFDYSLDRVVDGTVEEGTSTYVVKVSPGIGYALDESLALALEIPITVFGVSSTDEIGGIPVVQEVSSWGITVTVTMKLL